MIVLIEQRSDAVSLFIGVECTVRKIIDTHTSRIHRPQRGGNITLVVEPRPHPEQIATRDKLTGHFGMRGREWLEDVELSSIANRPRNENQTESKREDGAEEDGLTEPA